MEPFTAIFLPIFLGVYFYYIFSGAITVCEDVILNPSPINSPTINTRGTRPSIAIIKNNIPEHEFFLD